MAVQEDHTTLFECQTCEFYQFDLDEYVKVAYFDCPNCGDAFARPVNHE